MTRRVLLPHQNPAPGAASECEATSATSPRPPSAEPAKPAHAGAALPRIGYSLAEAAAMLGMRPDALRRTIERHLVAEGPEFVALLNHGIVARRRKNLRRWTLYVPRHLLAESVPAK